MLKQLHWYHEYLCFFFDLKHHIHKMSRISMQDPFDISIGNDYYPFDIQQNCYLKGFKSFDMQYFLWNSIFVDKFLLWTFVDFGILCKLFWQPISNNYQNNGKSNVFANKKLFPKTTKIQQEISSFTSNITYQQWYIDKNMCLIHNNACIIDKMNPKRHDIYYENNSIFRYVSHRNRKNTVLYDVISTCHTCQLNILSYLCIIYK